MGWNLHVLRPEFLEPLKGHNEYANVHHAIFYVLVVYVVPGQRFPRQELLRGDTLLHADRLGDLEQRKSEKMVAVPVLHAVIF